VHAGTGLESLSVVTSRILVVEDDSAMRAYLTETLTGAGHVVVSVADGQSAKRFFRTASLVLLDLDLPRVEGLSLLAEIRCDPRTEDLPVVIVSGYRAIGSVVAGLDGGANDYLTKPVDSAELVARVRTHLRAARQAQGWRQSACEDPLTGVLNRRGLLRCLERETGRATRFRTPLSVVFLDVDGFKAINDRFGHRQGDAVLRAIGQMLRRTLRRYDAVGRWGGDEFVLVLPGSSRAATAVALARLEPALASAIAGALRGPSVASLSFGVATLGDDVARGAPSSGERLVDAADRAMYQRKAKRTNARMAASEAGSPSPDRARGLSAMGSPG
jgi:diguanylate cyclase (GGDEF)-like protein